MKYSIYIETLIREPIRGMSLQDHKNGDYYVYKSDNMYSKKLADLLHNIIKKKDSVSSSTVSPC